MGNSASQSDKEKKARSDLIDKQLEDDGRKFKQECKILLLGPYSVSFKSRLSLILFDPGTEESGKSTIVICGLSGPEMSIRKTSSVNATPPSETPIAIFAFSRISPNTSKFVKVMLNCCNFCASLVSLAGPGVIVTET